MADSRDIAPLLVDITRQVFEGQKTIVTPSGPLRVLRTSRQGLRRVEFTVEGQRLIEIEQNPATSSQWAELARAGHQVMQFKDVETNRYLANVVDGRATFYGASAGTKPRKFERD